MRELDRNNTPPRSCAIIGPGRLGTALAIALRSAGLQVAGPLGRGSDPRDVELVLLCVPDAEIAAAAAAVTPGPLVGHCSGATGLDVLAAHEAFALHPLLTVSADRAPAFAGAGCAIAGSTPRALGVARALADRLGMRGTVIADADRGAYHAAASIASNFLVTLEDAAERLAATAGVDRALLAPLVRAAVANWEHGGAAALTGPIARGDAETVARQRAAVAERAPDLVPLYDALADATRALARSPAAHAARAASPARSPEAGAEPTTRPALEPVRTIAAIRARVAAARAAGRRIGLVPTMGALHAGHAALIRAARATCDEVVVSLFVNPAQFDDAADLTAYPRDERRDAAIAAANGAHVLFAPSASEIYPRGFATRVTVSGLADVLEGAQRGPEHFAGVCTVVCKLFAIVTPDVAFFGQKDAQQVAVIRRMTTDLDLPVELAVLDTVREPDGLALSSRNVHLGPADRERATALYRALGAIRAAVTAGERDSDRVAAAGERVLRAADIATEYLAIVDPDTLTPLGRIDGRALVAVAARVGPVRLIDNLLIETTPAATRSERASTMA